MSVIEKVKDLFARDPIPIQYRSSIALAITLILTTSTLVKALPEETVGPAGSSDVLASDVQDDPTLPAGATDTATLAPSIGPTQPGATTSVPKVVVKKGGVNVTIGPGGVPIADLFTPAEDRIGITNNQITICGHAALTLAAAFQTSPDDLNVYWTALEERGGVHGRNVNVEWEDDKYTSAGAIEAVTTCKAKNPFILAGSIGFDQIPAARNLAEEWHMLYIHHMAREDLSKKYSFSYLASVDRTGYLAGEYMAKKHAGKRIGVIYRDSEFWDPGFKTFKARLEQLGGNLVHQEKVKKDENDFSAAIDTMNGDSPANAAQAVFIWENALQATKIVTQAKSQNYSPTWLVFPFNTTTDALGELALDPPLEGVAPWLAYSPGDKSGPFAAYKDEIEAFEAAYAKYRPEVQLNDIHFMAWVGAKQIHSLLEKCGRDCTRNKVAGLFLTGAETAVHPGCPVDFSKNGHLGGDKMTFFEAYRKPSGSATVAGWRHQADLVCKSSL